MHPLARNFYFYGMPQMGNYGNMGDFFQDLINNAQNALEKGVTKAEQKFLSDQLNSITSDPTIRQAMIETGNDTAIETLAAKLKAAQTSTYNTVKKNPYTTMAVVGGVAVLGIIGLVFLMKRR